MMGLTSPDQIPSESIQVPPDSGYAKLINQLESTKKSFDVDPTANELRRLHPHFIQALANPKFNVSEEERKALTISLNDGNPDTIIRLAEFVRDEYLAGENISVVTKRHARHFGDPAVTIGPHDLEIVLADQLIHREPRLRQLKQKIALEVIGQSLGDSNLEPY